MKMIRQCDNCGHSYNADMRNVNRGWGKCCSKSCAAKLKNKTAKEDLTEYEVKFIAEEPIPAYPIPDSVTSRIKKHCTRCASIIGAECWKGVSGIFCSKECAMGQEIPPVTPPPVKEEITLFDHYAAHAIAALIIADNKQSITYIVDTAASYALIALEERKKYIND